MGQHLRRVQRVGSCQNEDDKASVARSRSSLHFAGDAHGDAVDRSTAALEDEVVRDAIDRPGLLHSLVVVRLHHLLGLLARAVGTCDHVLELGSHVGESDGEDFTLIAHLVSHVPGAASVWWRSLAIRAASLARLQDFGPAAALAELTVLVSVGDEVARRAVRLVLNGDGNRGQASLRGHV